MENITNIVVSRYNKNVDFAYKINDNKNINVLVYDKENPDNPLNIPVNKGNEASVYLKYIIDFYDHLSDFTFFIHDEEYAWHHTGSIADKYQEAFMSNKKYYNINDKSHNTMRDVIDNICPEYGWTDYFLEWYNKFIGLYVPLYQLDLDYLYKSSAQFLVHKDLIRNFPKEFYENLYNWLIETELENSINGRFFEYTWHILWEVYPNLQSNNSV